MKRLVAVMLLAGCSSGVPTATPGVEQMGAAVLRYRGPELEVALGFRFATASLGEEWLILDLAVTAAPGQTVEVRREKVFLLTPQGERLPLASQVQFAAAYPQLQATVRRAALAADPLDYFNRELACNLEFFAVPGEGLAFPSVHLDDRRVCRGFLFFYVPGGIQPGTWTLGIDVVETKVRIPFRLAGS